MRELGARIGPHGAVDALGIAEPVAEGVHVMNGHDAQGDPALALLPRHPVRDAAHVDGGEDWFANGAVGQQGFAGSDGLVVAHVLVHGQHDAGLFTGFDCLDCLGVISTERFLGEDTLHDATIAGGLYDLELVVGRHGNVEYLD